MNIDRIAAQLRASATIFKGNVAGAAGYANGVLDQAWLPLPAAYVIPGGQDAEPNEDAGGFYQIIHERISVIVVLSTLHAGGERDLADRRAQAAAAQLDIIRAAIFRAILNWRPDWNPQNPDANRETKGLYFIGGHFPEANGFDRARFFYEFSFGLDTTITDVDGWQLSSDPLIDVQGTIAPQGVVFDVPFSQAGDAS